jgi:hypothetical protein
MNKSFFNPATWLEKAEQLRLERQRREEPPAPSTFFQMANAGVDLDLSSPTTDGDKHVVGSTPFPVYPGAASPWSGPQPGLEAPLGEALGPAPVVGEPHEVAASLAAEEPAALSHL